MDLKEKIKQIMEHTRQAQMMQANCRKERAEFDKLRDKLMPKICDYVEEELAARRERLLSAPLELLHRHKPGEKLNHLQANLFVNVASVNNDLQDVRRKEEEARSEQIANFEQEEQRLSTQIESEISELNLILNKLADVYRPKAHNETNIQKMNL